ncbi:MAG TPA: hypothetical protein VF461_20345 [Gemmatimonadaceae bacterium]
MNSTNASLNDSVARVWPLRLMALVLGMLGLVPMANLVAPGGGMQWWNPSVRLWTWWGVAVAGIALFVARYARRVGQAAPALYASVVLRPSRRAFVVALSASVCALGAFFSWYLFRLQPVTIDELSMQWQARLLAGGRLFARGEPHMEFFNTMQTVVVDGRWFMHFPLGAYAPLSAGMAAGIPWLVNPVLAGIGAVAVYRFLVATTSELEARSVALLFAFSPFVLFMAASQLDHVAALVAIWCAIAMLPAWLESATASRARATAGVVGLFLGAAATIRPYDAALCAIAVGAFQLHALRRRSALASSLVVQVLAGLVPVALLLGTNWATTGHPLTFAYDALNGGAHRPGFHVDPMGEAHTPRRGIYNVSAYLMRLDLWLLGWPVPALLLVVGALALQRRASKWDNLLLGMLGATLVGYWAFWGEGRGLGPRFLFTTAPVFLLFAARSLTLLRERLTRPELRGAVALLAPLWLALGWLAPAAAAQPSGTWAIARRTEARFDATSLIEQAVAARQLSHAVVFVSDGWHARLVARLQALGARPFGAQEIVEHYDACMLQTLLDSAEGAPIDPATRWRLVSSTIARSPTAPPAPGTFAGDRLALVLDTPMSVSCQREWSTALSNGVDLPRFLPHNGTDAAGRLTGDVIYARDFGARNALLADRFGDRAWYIARVTGVGNELRVSLEPQPH